MIKVRKSSERGHANYGWLDTYHTFSFGSYDDPKFRSFRSLRVINEDWVAAGKGFDPHPHRDMEILTYIISGSLAHKDSSGNSAVLTRGEIQYMNAGSGILHSEYNPSETEPTRLLQIWITPKDRGLTPSYNQQSFSPTSIEDKFLLLAAPSEGLIQLNQDALLYAAKLNSGKSLDYKLGPARHGWVQVISGALMINDVAMEQGDGAALEPGHNYTFKESSPTEFLFFDLA